MNTATWETLEMDITKVFWFRYGVYILFRSKIIANVQIFYFRMISA